MLRQIPSCVLLSRSEFWVHSQTHQAVVLARLCTGQCQAFVVLSRTSWHEPAQSLPAPLVEVTRLTNLLMFGGEGTDLVAAKWNDKAHSSLKKWNGVKVSNPLDDVNSGNQGFCEAGKMVNPSS